MNEQNYLNYTLTSLRAAYERLTANITEKDENYKDLQEFMIDYKAELDKFEVYDYQQTLSMIDKQGFRQVMEREQVKKLIESPYFGNFDFQYAWADNACRCPCTKSVIVAFLVS